MFPTLIALGGEGGRRMEFASLLRFYAAKTRIPGYRFAHSFPLLPFLPPPPLILKNRYHKQQAKVLVTFVNKHGIKNFKMKDRGQNTLTLLMRS